MPLVRLTIEPWKEVEVSDGEYWWLARQGLIYTGATPPPAPPAFTDEQYAEFANAGYGPLAELLATRSEVIEARGQRSKLGLRIDTISNFASPNAGGNIVGQYTDNSFHGTASTTLVGAADRVDMAPFYTSQPLRIDQLGVAVSTGVAGALGRCFIYECDETGWPDELLYEGASDLDFSAVAYRGHSLDFTFDAGRQYWLGVRHSSTATVRAISVSSAVNLGITSSASSYFTILRRTIPFATPLPAQWAFVNGDRTANIAPPSIRMRIA